MSEYAKRNFTINFFRTLIFKIDGFTIKKAMHAFINILFFSIIINSLLFYFSSSQASSFFNSNTVPLRLVFNNADPLADPISVMFKAGEDMRQDMLTMQMIRIMDKLWLSEGLDLRMITFRCMATGPSRGKTQVF